MSSVIRAIGVCTGGGDCPGLNAVIRAVTKTAINVYGWRVLGIEDGFNGLIWPEKTRELTLAGIRGILPRGGTILGTTNRGNPFAYELVENGRKVVKDFSRLCLDNLGKLGLDALVIIGGDGTLKIACEFHRLGMRVIGVPKTIDNDLSATEVTFGFQTALATATDAIDRIHTTAESHHRVMIVEVMGRDAGWIALHAGIAGGADVILLPEIPFTLEKICQKIERREAQGSKFSVVVVAEGVKLPENDPTGKPIPASQPGNVGNTLADSLREFTHKEVRVTVLGHLQRGGPPVPYDRLLASRFGVMAAHLIAEGKFGSMVCLQCDQIRWVPLEKAVGVYKQVDPTSDYVRTARSLGIVFGD
ncbi:MAG: 6-phosphofructokinase [Acidobacteria bacterium]|nr:6-phosphofructokinase [Acidobacteriota bacterium]